MNHYQTTTSARIIQRTLCLILLSSSITNDLVHHSCHAAPELDLNLEPIEEDVFSRYQREHQHLHPSSAPTRAYLDPPSNAEEWTIESGTPYPVTFIELRDRDEKWQAEQDAKELERRRLNLQELEEEWMEEDYDEDDIPIDEDLYSEIETRKNEAEAKLRAMAERMDILIEEGDGRLISEDKDLVAFAKGKKELEALSSPPMVFVKLSEEFRNERKNPSKSLSSSSAWDELAAICNDVILKRRSHAVIDPKCFPIEPDSVMITAVRPWEGEKIWNFFMDSRRRADIVEMTWNGRTVVPRDDTSVDSPSPASTNAFMNQRLHDPIPRW